MTEKLSLVQKLAYSVGHFYNDACASMWFTYLLLFYTRVIGFSSVAAANLLLIGQIVDGVATPLVGLVSDKLNGFFCYTKRKSWHLLGTVLVTVSFAFVFREPVFDVGLPTDASMFAYYVPFIAIFQIGWATVQINHLSLIPELTNDDKTKITLNSWRFGFLILANIFIYIFIPLFLKVEIEVFYTNTCRF